MTVVHFYEKPGCAANARQKLLLAEAGHEVIAHDLLAHPWRAAELYAFLAERPTSEWFNPAAPRIKSGEISPAAPLGPDMALRLMMEDPLLIRRPLIEADGRRCAGLDQEPALSLLGPRTTPNQEGCAHSGDSRPCSAP